MAKLKNQNCVNLCYSFKEQQPRHVYLNLAILVLIYYCSKEAASR